MPVAFTIEFRHVAECCTTDCILPLQVATSLEVTIMQNVIPAAGETMFFLNCVVTLPHWNLTSIEPTIEFTGPFHSNDVIEDRVMMVNESTYVRKLKFHTIPRGNYSCLADITLPLEIMVKSKCFTLRTLYVCCKYLVYHIIIISTGRFTYYTLLLNVCIKIHLTLCWRTNLYLNKLYESGHCSFLCKWMEMQCSVCTVLLISRFQSYRFRFKGISFGCFLDLLTFQF